MITALDGAVARVKKSTSSIVGRCNSPAPAEFELQERLPDGACALLVREDFLDVPRSNDHLWLDSLYVALVRPTGGQSSVLILQTGGQLWLTNSVLQGADGDARAIDVNANNGGSPKLFVADTTIAHFARIEGPGVLVSAGAQATLQRVTFRNMSLLRPPEDAKRQFMTGTAVAARAGDPGGSGGAAVLLEGVVVDGDFVYGQQLQGRAVDAAKGPPAAQVYAGPGMQVWQWPGGPSVAAIPIVNSSSHEPGFLERDAVLRFIETEQQQLQDERIGPLPPPIPPPPAPAPVPPPTQAPESNVTSTPGASPTAGPPTAATAPGDSGAQLNTTDVPNSEVAAGGGSGEAREQRVNGGLVAAAALGTAAAVAAFMAVVVRVVLRWDWRRRESAYTVPAPAAASQPLPPLPEAHEAAAGAGDGDDGVGVDGLTTTQGDSGTKTEASEGTCMAGSDAV